MRTGQTIFTQTTKRLPCLQCGTMVEPSSKNETALARRGRAYCSEQCKTSFLRNLSAVSMAETNRKYASERMKLNNPMFKPEILEKMRRSMKGKPIKFRGGNGQLTKQQNVLATAVNLPTEVAIPTKSVCHLFEERLPTCYKVDIGSAEHKLAIEVDGKSHLRPAIRAKDIKKTAVLNALNWTVIRFTNEQIDTNLQGCVEWIQRFLTQPVTKINQLKTEDSHAE